MAKQYGSLKGRLAVRIISLVWVGILALTITVDTRSEMLRANTWVSTHADSLPATLEDLADYSLAFRLAIFRAQSPTVKSKLMRDQIARFRQRNRLSPEQDELLRSAYEVVSPDAYTIAGADVARQKLRKICPLLTSLLSRQQRLDLNSLGPVGMAERGLLEWVRAAKRSVIETVLQAKTEISQCDCNVETDNWCPGCRFDYTCSLPEGQQCTVPPNYGCGCFQIYECNAFCHGIIGGGGVH